MTSTLSGYHTKDTSFKEGRDVGSLLSLEQGRATMYALMNAQERGTLHIGCFSLRWVEISDRLYGLYAFLLFKSLIASFFFILLDIMQVRCL